VGLFSSLEHPPESFWNRRTWIFAGAGLLCYGLSRWLFTFDSVVLLAIVSIVRFGPLLALTRSKRTWPVILATPYPFDLVFTAYSERSRWLGEDLAMEMSSPTVFLIFTGAALFVSLPLSGWSIARASNVPATEQLRSLVRLLFVITAVALVLPLPQWGVFLMHNIAEPLALAGFAAALGFGTRHDSKIEPSFGQHSRLPNQ
jgi:hypothetical protein